MYRHLKVLEIVPEYTNVLLIATIRKVHLETFRKFSDINITRVLQIIPDVCEKKHFYAIFEQIYCPYTNFFPIKIQSYHRLAAVILINSAMSIVIR